MRTHPFLSQALELANIRRGFCAPNPSVGAVIVSESGEVLATGYHWGAGHAHAEVDALKKLNGKAIGATIYITLEPCCHFGRTPPCTDAIIQAGIKHVVYGFKDPNPIVSGKSQKILAEKNITSEYVELAEINEFYRSYSYWHKYKKPYVTAKIAMSLDGKIAKKNKDPIQLTGLETAKLTHQYRKNSDAILTTAKTILHDDPQLNARGDEIIAKSIYILDRELSISCNAKIFSTAKNVTLFYSKKANTDKFVQQNVRCIFVDEINGKLNLNKILQQIGEDGIHDLWLEAGGTLFAECVTQKLAQKMLIYVAPRWLGEGLNAFAETFSLDLSETNITWQPVGDDVVCEMTRTDSH